ncbi:MAG: GGDEF domain-containing response regulator [Myxococcota bacterium]
MTTYGFEKRPCLLYVDGDRHRCERAEAALSSHAQVVSVADAATARTTFRAERPSIVVVVQNENENFGELIQQWRAEPNGADIPILAVSRPEESGAIAQAYADGASDWLPTPLDFATLGARLPFVCRRAADARAQRDQNDLLRQANSIAQLGYWMWTPSTNALAVSSIAGHILDLAGSQRDIDGDALLDAIHDDDRHRVRRAVSELRPGDASVRIEHRLASGEKDAVVCQEIQASQDAQGKLQLVGTIQDISERKRAERHIIRLAYNDELTGLPNRTFLWDTLNDRLSAPHANADIIALISVHIDGVHRIIDTFGHEAGDHLLRMVAERLDHVPKETESLCPEDTLSLDDTQRRSNALLARVSNDDFMFVFAAEADMDEVWKKADRIKAVLTEPIDIGGHPVVPGACLGIAVYPDHGKTASVLVKNAETAQHQAISEGPGSVILFAESLHASARERVTIEMALRRALEDNTFTLHYQPKVEAMRGQPVGMEALLRWNDPQLGSISPGRFIPVAEECGLIVPLGRWVLQTACAQTLAWRQSGFDDLRVAVNISADQFVQPNFISIVEQTLADTGLPPEGLELEITESLLMRDTDLAVQHLGQLRELGITVALDDFGTGYSSLSYLHRFPLDTLKIDRTFVTEMMTKTESAAVVRTIVLLSHNLHLKVVAEGVETEEQLAHLRSLGCDEIQGFYFSRALPADEFERWVRAASPAPACESTKMDRRAPGH